MEEKQTGTVRVSRSFIVQDGKMLALRRAAHAKYNPYLWETPGGKLDEGQNPTDALLREVLEETKLSIAQIVGVRYETPPRRILGGRFDGMEHIAQFSVSFITSGAVTISGEHEDYRWCGYLEFLKLDLTPETRSAALALALPLQKAGVR